MYVCIYAYILYVYIYNICICACVYVFCRTLVENIKRCYMRKGSCNQIVLGYISSNKIE